MPTTFSLLELLALLAAAFGVGAGVAYLFIRRDRRALASEVRSLWERLDAIFYRSPQAISLCELDFERGGLRILDCNEEACVLHGGSRDEMLAADIRMPLGTPEEQERVRTWFKAPRPGDLWHGLSKLCRISGTEIPVAYVWAKVEVGDRELVLAVERDISEQLRAETALKESEQRFRQLIETANCLLWRAHLREADNQLTWKFDVPLSGLRQRLFSMANVPPDESALWGGLNLPELATMNERCVAALKGGESSYRQEFRVVLPNETMWLQEHVDIKTVGPGEWNLVGVVVDITRLKESEAAMQTSEERNRLVLKASNDGIWDFDVASGEMATSERCRTMLGLSATEMPTSVEGWRNWIHPEDLPIEAAAWKKYRGTDEPCAYQARFRHGDGFWRWLMVRAIAVKNDLGEVVRVIGSHTDITELKRNDSELQQGRRLRAIGELVGGIAHEFNNLLTPMLLQTTMMTGDGTPQSELLKEQLMPVVGAIKEARELTQRILTFGRRSTDDLEQLDLTAAVHEHLELLRHTIDRRLVIDVIPPAQPMWVMQNRTDMAQIIINLVLNARDTLLEKTTATNDASWVPTITIRLATVSELASRSQTLSGLLADEGLDAVSWHRVTVRDNGMGMTDEVRERIFEPFYTTKEAGQGTGLGLATVWHLVKSMGGRVDVETKVGLGSAFHVSWPAISAPLETTEPAPLKSEPSTMVRRQSARILLVEDEVEVTGSLSRILEKWGHQVTAVRDGTSALRRLAGGENEFDICITDLNMPGASGFDVVRAIREQQLPLKVVVMGGYVTAGVRQELSAWQIESILPKPFSLEDIETSMKACGW